MSRNKKTKVILFDAEKKTYRSGIKENKKPHELVVCSAGNFINQVCKLFEDITPNLKANPLWENIGEEESEMPKKTVLENENV